MVVVEVPVRFVASMFYVGPVLPNIAAVLVLSSCTAVADGIW